MVKKYSRPEGPSKLRSTLGDINGIQASIIDSTSSNEQAGYLNFRGIEAGSGIYISIDDADDSKFNTNETKLVISSPEAMGVGINLGNGAKVYKDRLDGINFRYRTLSSITDAVILTEEDETINIDVNKSVLTTASNIGTGTGIFGQKVASDLQFKSLIAGNDISLSSDGTSITINSTATEENTTASNVGSGSQIFKQKNNQDLELRTLTSSSSNLTITQTTDTVNFSIDETHVNLGTVSSATLDIDVSLSTSYNVILANNVAITFSNVPSSGVKSFSLWLQQDTVGGRSVTYPNVVLWSNGLKPPLSIETNAVDLFVFTTWDGGTTWYGMISGVKFS